MPRIKITAGAITASAKLNDSDTAREIWDALPIRGRANLWGDEIYFVIPVEANEEAEARADVEVGTLAYWPPGNAFCIFWGPTPASNGSQPRAASPVNVVGKVLGDATQFRAVANGTAITLTQEEID